MNELESIVQAYEKATAEGKNAALATVVQVEGSSYRRPGARMLVTEDGHITGAISGGCLEGDALRKAQQAMLQGKNKLVIYDTTGEDDHKFGMQLGCNGIVSVLFEPFSGNLSPSPVTLLHEAIANREEGLLITAFNPEKTAFHPGTMGYLNARGGNWHSHKEAFTIPAETFFAGKKTMVQEVGAYKVLFQAVVPPVHLVIAGAGNDAQPMVEMAALLGWRVTVVDGRPAYAQRSRFRKADAVIVAKAEAVCAHVPVDIWTAFVLMTHNYNYDLELLRQLLKTPAFYIGILGPHQKTIRLLDDLTQNGLFVSNADLTRIFGPVGLNIGAEGAAEIALSVVSGIQAALSGSDGQTLKYREKPIHKPA